MFHIYAIKVGRVQTLYLKIEYVSNQTNLLDFQTKFLTSDMFGYLSGADFEPRCGVLVRFVKKAIQGYETDRYQSGQRLGAPARLANHVASLHYLHSDTRRRLKRLTE